MLQKPAKPFKAKKSESIAYSTTSVRLPLDLLKRVQDLAEKEGVRSTNEIITQILAWAVDSNTGKPVPGGKK